jgi:hypothetical protein
MPALKEIARWVDNRRRFRERLSTALQLSADPNAGSWCDLVVADAAAHRREPGAKNHVPFNLSEWNY